MQLQKALQLVQYAAVLTRPVDVVIIDNGAPDSAKCVVDAFSRAVPPKTIYLVRTKTGSGCARNAGMASVSVEWMVLTDDDCYIDVSYLVNFSTSVKGQTFRYETGQILLYASRDDPGLPSLILTYQHRHRRDNPGALAAIEGCPYGRSAYDTGLIEGDVEGVWNFWHSKGSRSRQYRDNGLAVWSFAPFGTLDMARA
jgi:glycosyltransferase involved in cell wall biosynthesis